MTVFRHCGNLPAALKGAVLAVGNFDGVHLGHQALLGQAGRLAEELGTTLAVLTFEPHPRSVFRPADPPFRLTPFRVKVRALEAAGVAHLIALHFDLDFAEKPAEDFVREILVEAIGVRQVVVGWDFRFGHKRAGDAALLRRLGDDLGFEVTVVQPVCIEDGEAYSSSNIRRYLREGAPEKAARLLGRPWEIDSRVLAGEKRGRALGFPTANMGLEDYLVPAHGVYAVRATFNRGGERRSLGGVANLGRRPTFGGSKVWLEVHLFDYSGNLYRRHLRVQFIEFLRPEKKFDGPEGLRAQIAEDCEKARAVLARRDGVGRAPAATG